MNEMNGTDDTEYEDDDYEQFNDDGTPEPDAEEVDVDQLPNATPANVTAQRAGRTGPSQPQAHEFMFNRDRSPRAATIPTSTVGAGRQGNNVPPSVNILGATSRLNAQIQDGIAIPVAGPSRRGRQNVEGNQTITDMLPIIETPSGSSHDPPNTQGQAIVAPNPYTENSHYAQYDGMDVDMPSSSGANLMDTDQWPVPEAGPSSTIYTGSPGNEEGNQWNMKRTLRDVFHFGRNSQENPHQHHYPPPPPPPPTGGAARY